LTSEPGLGGSPGISQRDTCLLLWRCPAYRWREPGPGFSTEEENPSPGNRRLLVEVGGERENPSGEEPSRVEYRLPGRGADRLVVALKVLVMRAE
jgi:hypothetical protein